MSQVVKKGGTVANREVPASAIVIEGPPIRRNGADFGRMRRILVPGVDFLEHGLEIAYILVWIAGIALLGGAGIAGFRDKDGFSAVAFLLDRRDPVAVNAELPVEWITATVVGSAHIFTRDQRGEGAIVTRMLGLCISVNGEPIGLDAARHDLLDDPVH